MTTEQRFFDKVDKTDGCWNWTGSHNGVGYGEIRIGGRKVYAHRWSYEHHHGEPIPDGLVIDHLCRNPRCVNPAHLEAVTTLENVRRGMAPGPKPERRAETCSHGHPYSVYEYVRPDGNGRNCSECVRERAREYQRRKRALRAA